MKFLRQEEGARSFCVGFADGELVEAVSRDGPDGVPEDVTKFGDNVDFTIMHGLLSQSNTVEVVPFVFCSPFCSSLGSPAGFRSLSDALFVSCSSEQTDSSIESLESSEKKIGGIFLSNVVLLTLLEFSY